MSTIKNERDSRKLRQRISELEEQVKKLEEELNETNNSTSEIIEDEIIVKLYQALSEILDLSKNEQLDSSRISSICEDVLNNTPEQIILDVKNKYINQGIDKSITQIKNKAEQARDLGSEVTAITAESLADSLEKIRV